MGSNDQNQEPDQAQGARGGGCGDQPDEGHDPSATTSQEPSSKAHIQPDNQDGLKREAQAADAEGLEKEEESEEETEKQQQPQELETEKEKPQETVEEQLQEQQHAPEPQQQPIQNQTIPDSEQVDQLSPQVQELLAIFPQIQPSILEDVLAAHRNDVGACISDLLAISDPTYKPSAQESMAQLDEEFARQISLQETQQQQAARSSLSEQQRLSNLPYQPRIKRTTPPNRSFVRPAAPQQAEADQAGGSNGKDELQKIADGLGKLAETGKTTMFFWIEKAKAKMQEIQLPTQSETLEGDYEHVGRPSSSSTPASSNPANPPNLSATSTTTKNARITPALPHASRYANTNRTTASTQPSVRSLGGPPPSTQPHPSSGTARATTEGYHVKEPDPTPEDPQKLVSGTLTHPSLDKLPSAASSAALPLNHHYQSRIRDEDEESLEYTRNPFEDDD